MLRLKYSLLILVNYENDYPKAPRLLNITQVSHSRMILKEKWQKLAQKNQGNPENTLNPIHFLLSWTLVCTLDLWRGREFPSTNIDNPPQEVSTPSLLLSLCLNRARKRNRGIINIFHQGIIMKFYFVYMIFFEGESLISLQLGLCVRVVWCLRIILFFIKTCKFRP